MSHEKSPHMVEGMRHSRSVASRTSSTPPKSLAYILSSQRRSSVQSDRHRVQNARPFADSAHVDRTAWKVNVKYSHLSYQQQERGNPSPQDSYKDSIPPHRSRVDCRIRESNTDASSRRVSPLSDSTAVKPDEVPEEAPKNSRLDVPRKKSRWDIPRKKTRWDNAIQSKIPRKQEAIPDDRSTRKRKHDHCAGTKRRTLRQGGEHPVGQRQSSNGLPPAQRRAPALPQPDRRTRRSRAQDPDGGESPAGPRRHSDGALPRARQYQQRYQPQYQQQCQQQCQLQQQQQPNSKPIFVKSRETSAGKTQDPKKTPTVTSERRAGRSSGTHSSVATHPRLKHAPKGASDVCARSRSSRGESISQKKSIHDFIESVAPNIYIGPKETGERNLQSTKEEALPKNETSTINQTTQRRDKTAKSPKAMKSITCNNLFGGNSGSRPLSNSLGGKSPNVTSERRAGQWSGTHSSVAARPRLKQAWNGTSDACARSKSSGDEKISQKKSMHNFITSAAPNSCIGPKETGERNLQSAKEVALLKNKTSTIDHTTERRNETERSPKAMKSITGNNLFGENYDSRPLGNSMGGGKAPTVTSKRRAGRSSGPHSSGAARPRLKHSSKGTSDVCARSKSSGYESISQKNSMHNFITTAAPNSSIGPKGTGERNLQTAKEETLPKNMTSTIDRAAERRNKTVKSSKAMKSITGNTLFGENYDSRPLGNSMGGGNAPTVTSERRARQSSGTHSSVAARSRLKHSSKGTSDVCARGKSIGEESISQENSSNNFIKSAAPNSCIGLKETGELNLQSAKEETLPENKTSTIDRTTEKRVKTARSPKAMTGNNMFGENYDSRSLGNINGGGKSPTVTSERRAGRSSASHSSVAARPRLKPSSRDASDVCAWSKSIGEESISQKNSINNFIESVAPNSCIGLKGTDERNLQSAKDKTLPKNKTSTIDQTSERRDKTARSPKAITGNNMFGENSDSHSLGNPKGCEVAHQTIPNNLSDSSYICTDAAPKTHIGLEKAFDIALTKDEHMTKNNITPTQLGDNIQPKQEPLHDHSKEPMMVEDDKLAIPRSPDANINPKSCKIKKHDSLLERKIVVLNGDDSPARSKLDTIKKGMADVSCTARVMPLISAPQSKLEDTLTKKKKVFSPFRPLRHPFRVKVGCIVAVRFQKIADFGNCKVLSAVKDGDSFRPIGPSLENAAELKQSDIKDRNVDATNQNGNVNTNGEKTLVGIWNSVPVEDIRKKFEINNADKPLAKDKTNTKRKPSHFEVWSDPIPGKDDGISLLGSWIRCVFPKSFVANWQQNCKHGNQSQSSPGSRILEGNVISIGHNHTSQGGITVGLLVDCASMKSLPFLQVVSDDANDSTISESKQKRRKLEAKIRGKNKVVVTVALASVFQRNASKLDPGVVTQWVVRKRVIAKPTGKKPSKSERKRNKHHPQSLFVGDVNDASTQQEKNWRWIASRAACPLTGTTTGHSCSGNNIRDSVSELVGEVVNIDVHHCLATVATVTVKRLLTPEQTTLGRLAHHKPLDLFDPGENTNESYFQAPIEQLIVIGRKLNNGCCAVGDHGWNFSIKHSRHIGDDTMSLSKDDTSQMSKKTCHRKPIESTSNVSYDMRSVIHQAFSGLVTSLQSKAPIDFKLPHDLGQVALRPSFLPITGDMKSKSYTKTKSKQGKKYGKRKNRASSENKMTSVIKAEPATDTEEEEQYDVLKPVCSRTADQLSTRCWGSSKQKLCSDKSKQPFFRENARPRAIKIGHIEEKATLSGRAARANQRRMFKSLTALGGVSEKVDRLAGRDREQQLRFDKSQIHGWGVFAEEPINAGDMIIEYRGEIIGNAVADKRELEYQRSKLDDYMFRIDACSVCDATILGNVARYINSSCTPNCHTSIITAGENKRIVIYAKKDIHVGEELCYDYKFSLEYDQSKRVSCHCGSYDCRGFMNWDKKYL